MDWKRAKTILIIMFLVINTFLSYQLISVSRSQYRYTNTQELKSIKKYLESKNIKLETDIPERVSVIPSLRVKYTDFEAEGIKKMFFTGQDYTQTELADGFIISNPDISVEVKNGIQLTYKNQAIKVKKGEVDKYKCLSNADRFIETLKLNTGSKYVKLNEIGNGYVRIILGQQYKKIPVENSQIVIIATEEGVSEATVNWFEWIKPDKRYNTTTPIIALLKAYENKKENTAPIYIKQIRQGYYFNIDRQKAVQESIPLEGTAFPMWVIASEKSQIYINAWTEKEEKIQ